MTACVYVCGGMSSRLLLSIMCYMLLRPNLTAGSTIFDNDNTTAAGEVDRELVEIVGLVPGPMGQGLGPRS